MGWHDHRGHNAIAAKEDAAKEVPMDSRTFEILPINHSRRVYNNDDFVDNGVAGEHLKDHVEYNRKMRFGCALFINGICLNRGYLSVERCIAIEQELAKLNIQPVLTRPPYR